MRSVQLELFDWNGMMNKEAVSVNDYYCEFQSLSCHQRNAAGYEGDIRAERSIRELASQGEFCYSEWSGQRISDQACREALFELLVRLWCVKINGKVSRDIYQTPRLPKVYNPVFDDHLASRIPKEVMKLIPLDVLLVFLMEYEGNEQRVYHVTYHDGKRWFNAANLFDYRKRKWMDGRTTRLYGEQFRADLEHQWWTREGYEKAKADHRLDPQVAAVWSNYVKFFGRDEALCRLGLPPVSTGYNERHFEECAKYGWYFERESNPPVQPRRGNRRRTIG